MKHHVYILALCVGALLFAAPAAADVINLHYVSIATGVDDGPQDGNFDSVSSLDLGAVNNNGYTSFRTAFEFSLAGLPPGATINSATLTFPLSNFEGTRALELHGYAGDGTVQLGDFALNRLVGSASVGTCCTQVLVFDVTSFVAGGGAFLGFSVREEPANPSNFLVMRLEGLHFFPVLAIEFSAEYIVDIDIKAGSVPNSINPSSMGRIPVAILSSPTFDAPRAVDTTSLTFGRTGGEASLDFCSGPEDVNSDGLLDVVCHFDTNAAGFLSGDTQGVLKGKTLSGVPMKGTDSVRIVR